MLRLLPLVLFLTACQPMLEQTRTDVVTPQVQTASTRSDDDRPISTAVGSIDTVDTISPQIDKGDGQFLKRPTSNVQSARETENGVTLNFEAVPLADFIKVVFGEVLKVGYSIDPDITGKVTIQTPTPIAKNDLLPLTEDILAMHSARILTDNHFYRVVPAAEADSFVTMQSDPLSVGYGVYVVPLRHIAAREMQKILEPYMGDDTQIEIDNRRNLLLIRGHSKQVASLRQSISLFDVDWLEGMSVGMFPLQNAEAEKVKLELEAILSGTDEEAAPLGGLIKLVSIERLNAVLAISPDPSALDTVEHWLTRLDQESVRGQQRLYVYKVQNAKAMQLAEVLANVFGIETASTSAAQSSRLAPGESMTTMDSDTGQTLTASDQSKMGHANRGRERTPSHLLKDSVEIIADDIRNALVIMATPKDYEMIHSTIEKLDTVPHQVMIEASIVEVTLSDSLNYGVEWFFKNGIGSKQGVTSLDLGNSGISALSPSFSFTVVDSLSNVRFALNALAAESNLNVLSSPSLMVLDNQAARINVGDEIPIPTRQSTSNLDPNAPTVNEIDFRKTGVTLTVLPRVNNSGLVTMEIRQEVSNAVQTTTSSLDAPTIQTREIESVVAINSGETIVLGGLIQDSKTNNESGLPGLHKLPLVGNLFGQTSDEVRRTELLVLITPRVVRDRSEARLITDELRRKMQGIDPVSVPMQLNQDS